MSQQLHHLSVSKTARIATHGDPKTARFVWIALHGYGQLLPYFIRPFQTLSAEDHFVVAPEGLSRFYLTGTSGRVGASWMTKEDRLTEIEDQVDYLNRVRKWTEDQLGDQSVTWIGFGFSQGVATLNRWLAKQRWAPHHIVNWAGSPPWDMAYDQQHLQEATWWYRLGTEDEYIPNDAVARWLNTWSDQGIHPSVHFFDGKHQIPNVELEKLAQAIQQK